MIILFFNKKQQKVHQWINMANVLWMCGEEPVLTWAGQWVREGSSGFHVGDWTKRNPTGRWNADSSCKASGVQNFFHLRHPLEVCNVLQIIQSLYICKQPCEHAPPLYRRLSHDALPSSLCAPLNKPATGCCPKYRRSKAFVSLMFPKTVVPLI